MIHRSTVLGVLTCVAIAGASLAATPAAGQQAGTQVTGIRAIVLPDVDNLSQKYSGLVGAMAGRYDWRPGEGVRSAGEVFNLIVAENGMLVEAIAPGQGAAAQGAAPITEPAQLQEALRSSYATLQQAIAGLAESDLGTATQIFGQQTTKLGAIYMVLADQHEHLGQSIAYARSNGVTPPWSLPRQ